MEPVGIEGVNLLTQRDLQRGVQMVLHGAKQRLGALVAHGGRHRLQKGLELDGGAIQMFPIQLGQLRQDAGGIQPGTGSTLDRAQGPITVGQAGFFGDDLDGFLQLGQGGGGSQVVES